MKQFRAATTLIAKMIASCLFACALLHVNLAQAAQGADAELTGDGGQRADAPVTKPQAADTPVAKPQAPEPIRIAPEELHAAFSRNLKAASRRFGGKLVILTGTAEAAGLRFADMRYELWDERGLGFKTLLRRESEGRKWPGSNVEKWVEEGKATPVVKLHAVRKQCIECCFSSEHLDTVDRVAKESLRKASTIMGICTVRRHGSTKRPSREFTVVLTRCVFAEGDRAGKTVVTDEPAGMSAHVVTDEATGITVALRGTVVVASRQGQVIWTHDIYQPAISLRIKDGRVIAVATNVVLDLSSGKMLSGDPW